MRWHLKPAEYEYEVIYKAGKMNVNTDALSRNPVDNLKIQILNEETDTSDKSDSEIFDAPSKYQINESINENLLNTGDTDRIELNASQTEIEIDNDARNSINTEGFASLRDTDSTESNTSQIGTETDNDARNDNNTEGFAPINEYI
jgi:hypothetical protein